jgi:hypothetical protein
MDSSGSTPTSIGDSVIWWWTRGGARSCGWVGGRAELSPEGPPARENRVNYRGELPAATGDRHRIIQGH